MNIVKLEHEQQTTVINSAVNILRKKMLGKVFRIETAEQEFLAQNKKFEGIKPSIPPENPTIKEREHFITNGSPLELDVISVSRAVEEAVKMLIARERPHIENPTVSESMLSILGDKVLRIFNTPQKERIALPKRWAERIAQRMRDNDGEIESTEYQTLYLLREYFKSEDNNAKTQLFESIGQSLEVTHTLYEANEDDDAVYDLSSLQSDSGEEEEDEDRETRFKPGDIFATDGGLGMREPVADADFRLEMEAEMKLSETERELHSYLPREIMDDKNIISEAYQWIAYGEEWQRENIDMRKDYSKNYLAMLEKILMRKLIIYAHAEQTLIAEEGKQGKGPVNKKGCRNIGEHLPDLHGEIEILWDKIEKIKDKKTPTKKAKTSPSGIQSILERSFSALRRKYRTVLQQFLEFENYDEVEKIYNSLLRAYADLESHCLKNDLESNIIGTALAETKDTKMNQDDALTVDEYLTGPDYFTNFPTTLLSTKSESERILEKVCHIEHNPIFSYGTGDEPIVFIYSEEDGSKSPDSEKMKVLESTIRGIIERKMALYFHVTKWFKDHENDEVGHYRYILENEIYAMENALEMLSRRIRWENDISHKGAELQAEIDYLSQCRNNLLGRFVGEHDRSARNSLEGKILAFTNAIASRNKELSQSEHKIEKPLDQIPAEPLSASEGGIAMYTPVSLRKSESILFGRTIPYYVNAKQMNSLDHPWEKKKIQANHHLERKMMFYLFALKRINAIDDELSNFDGPNKEQLILERDLIEEKSVELHGEILNLIEHIRELNVYSAEQCEGGDEERSQLLCDKAMSLHAQLDGILAHSDTDFAKKVEYYWHTLQRYVLRFRGRVLIATEKGHLASIKQLQTEFDTEMHFIILDMQKTLGELQASKKTTKKMVATVTTIRRELFGNKDA